MSKYLNALHVSKLRMSSHRLEVKAGRWVKPNRIPLIERKGVFFCDVLEDEYHFVLECPAYKKHIFQNIFGSAQTCSNL